jgi:hypothetical protein
MGAGIIDVQVRRVVVAQTLYTLSDGQTEWCVPFR